MEIRKLPVNSYPLGNISQFINPVILNKVKRRKDMILTAQSLAFYFIYPLPFYNTIHYTKRQRTLNHPDFNRYTGKQG